MESEPCKPVFSAGFLFSVDLLLRGRQMDGISSALGNLPAVRS